MTRLSILALVFVIGVVLLPRQLASAGSGLFFSDDPERAASMSRAANHWVAQPATFSTGSPRFDGEWKFGTYLMLSIGHGQVGIGHPSFAASSRASMDAALGRLLLPEVRLFDREAWHEDAMESLSGSHGHAAFLGYTNLALSLRRRLGPSEFDGENDAITEALARRLEASDIDLLETYPGERYPVDNAAVIASIALRDRALGREPRPSVARWLQTFASRYVDGETGLVIQAVATNGTRADSPRGSGTALASYFLSFASPEISLALHEAVRRELAGTVLGFGVVNEYPDGARGRGDIDSGPLVFGWSISAMGFSLGSAKAHRDERAFEEMWRSFQLFGAPHQAKERFHFVSGGALGDAILFAMLTALPARSWSST